MKTILTLQNKSGKIVYIFDHENDDEIIKDLEETLRPELDEDSNILTKKKRKLKLTCVGFLSDNPPND